MNFDFVYKICTKYEWNDAKENKIFKGTPLDLKDGYIHFSDINQIKQTLNKFYLNQPNLVLLKVDALKLQKLVWEQSSSGDMFPHLYSDFDVGCVVKEYPLDLKEDGNHKIPVSYTHLTLPTTTIV